MKSIFVLALAIVAAVTAEDQPAELDIETVINNPQQLGAFMSCFIGKIECPKELAAYKQQLKEAFEDACGHCTPKQKTDLKKFLDAVKVKMPAEYSEFKQIFDPESKFFGPLEAAISA